jgi:hypothetical protein
MTNDEIKALAESLRRQSAAYTPVADAALAGLRAQEDLAACKHALAELQAPSELIKWAEDTKLSAKHAAENEQLKAELAEAKGNLRLLHEFQERHGIRLNEIEAPNMGWTDAKLYAQAKADAADFATLWPLLDRLEKENPDPDVSDAEGGCLDCGESYHCACSGPPIAVWAVVRAYRTIRTRRAAAAAGGGDK